jgi:S1-C subfamily serine protease
VNSSGSTAQTNAIAAKVSPALVDINSSFGYQGAQGAGTGIVLTSNGEVLTNNHVINGATKISVTDVGNGKTYSATVLGYDDSHDVALLQLKGASGLQTAHLADSSKVAVGESVVAVGNAGGTGGTPSNAGGSVTALNQSITAGDDLDGVSEQLSGLIEVNANIQPGDSGGSLVNTAGDVIGIDTAASQGFNFQSTASQGFAIPINEAMSIARQILSGHGSATTHVGATAFLGVELSSSSSSSQGNFGSFGDNSGNGSGASTGGATVSGVVSGGPAAQAGLTQGDTITSVDGNSVDSPASISAALVGHHPGDRIQIGWVDSSGQTHTATVVLGSGPPA